MMNIFIVFAFFGISISVHSLDSIPIAKEKMSNFQLNMAILENGTIQYHASHFDNDAFAKLPKEIRNLDVMRYHKKNHTRFLLYKHAFLIPAAIKVIFDKNLYGEREYILATNSNLSNLEIDKSNPMKQIHTVPLPKMPGLESYAIYSVQHAELESKTAATWYKSSLVGIFEGLREKGLPYPRTMVTNNLSSNQNILLGGLTIASFYPLKDKSLVVSYTIAILKPQSLADKMAFRTGIAQLFLGDEEKEIQKSVKATRQYLSRL